MPRITPVRLACACAAALTLSLPAAASAAPAGFSTSLRVVGAGNRVLSEEVVSTHAVSVRTSHRATCFGAGTGGSGKRVPLAANTAMGVLAEASRSTAELRPLLISDHFDFGLALCGIGKSVAKGKASWYLKIDHRALSVGGEKAKVRPGDEVLWDLAPSYPYPNELVMTAPESATPGMPFTVHVFSYDEKGRRKPVAGATVTARDGSVTGISPTAADGSTSLAISGPVVLSATHGREIPSAGVGVCAVGAPCLAE